MLFFCQRIVLRWLIAFTAQFKHKHRTTGDSNKSVETTSITSHDSNELSTPRETSPVNETTANPQPRHSDIRYDMLCEVADIVRAVLYCTQENVLVVHELFRQVKKQQIYYLYWAESIL